MPVGGPQCSRLRPLEPTLYMCPAVPSRRPGRPSVQEGYMTAKAPLHRTRTSPGRPRPYRPRTRESAPRREQTGTRANRSEEPIQGKRNRAPREPQMRRDDPCVRARTRAYVRPSRFAACTPSR
ncbi:hypothetical protein C8Q77DRAFT_11819 [Trametes polyzona]|nr:hypothetical protein C8Q77DRAFT_11819 [Trametes polyzona]